MQTPSSKRGRDSNDSNPAASAEANAGLGRGKKRIRHEFSKGTEDGGEGRGEGKEADDGEPEGGNGGAGRKEDLEKAGKQGWQATGDSDALTDGANVVMLKRERKEGVEVETKEEKADGKEADDKLENAKAEQRKAKAEQREAEEKLEKAKAEQREAEEKQREAEEKLEKAKAEQREAEEKLEKAKAEQREAEEKLEKAKAEQREADKKLEEAAQEKEGNPARFERAKEKMQMARENVNDARENVNTARENVNTARENVDTARENVDTARENVDTARENVNTARQNVNTASKVVNIALDATQRAGALGGFGPGGFEGTAEMADVKPAMAPISVQQDWDAAYADGQSVVEQLLEELLRQEDTDSTYSMAFLCQSSGYGKSRAVRELARQLKVVYVCLRKTTDGWPPKTEAPADALLSIRNETHMQRWLRAVVSFREKLNQGEPRPAEFWERQDIVNSGKGASQSWKECMDDQTATVEKGQRTLIVIDEAQHMLDHKLQNKRDSVFHALRRELAPEKAQSVFVLLVSTTSRVSNFWPSEQAASESDRSGGLRNPVITLLGSFDARNRACAADTAVAESGGVASEAQAQPGDIRGYGRPLWMAYKTVEAAVDMGVRKLTLQTGDRDLNIPKLLDDQGLGLLAVAAVRLAVHILPTHSDAQSLVAKHVATLLAVATDRSKVVVAYPPEPILSEAAARVWHWKAPPLCGKRNGPCSTACNLPAVLKILATKIGDCLVSRGERGELVAKIMLLLAADGCERLYGGELFSEPFTLTALLKELARYTATEAISIDIGGTVQLMSFVQLDQIGDRDPQVMLEQMYDRCVGGVMPPNYTGADLMIPFRKLANGAFGALLVQVKNYDGCRGIANDERAAGKLRPSNVFGAVKEPHGRAWRELTCVGLHMELGSSNDGVHEAAVPARTTRVTAGSDQNPPTVIYEGLMLGPELVPAVRAVLSATARLSHFTGSTSCGQLVASSNVSCSLPRLV